MEHNFNSDLNTFKVGFRTYSIERTTGLFAPHGTLYGMVDHDDASIKIASQFDRNDRNHTFIHEMMHCICRRFGLNDLHDDEQTIDLLATGIYEAILDNPNIFKMADI